MNGPMVDAPPLFGIYGASGCGRGVLPVAAAMLSARQGVPAFELVFVDDSLQGKTVNQRRVLSYSQFLSEPASSRRITIAIADPAIRERLAARCREDRLDPFSVQAANAVVMDDVQIGEGALISPFVTLTSNIRIGRHFHANLYSYVEHDCVIGDFVTFAPGVHCNGNVHIEDGAYLGSGCVLRQGKPGAPLVIGRGAVVGMGAVVTSSVPAGAVVVGNPARPLHKA